MLPIFQASRRRFQPFAKSWKKQFGDLSRRSGNKSSFKQLTSDICILERFCGGRWIGRPFSTDDGEKRTKTTKNDYASQIRHRDLDERVSKSAILNVKRSEISGPEKVQCYHTKQEIAKIKGIDDFVTIIIFYIETTGLSSKTDRIIEICLCDLAGGEDCTFHRFVNPGCFVPNSRFHGVKSCKVNRPDVPGMEEVQLDSLQFVKSRQKNGGFVMLFAHNARNFDVPFLIYELNRCSIEIPSNWLFLDILPLARELLKLGLEDPSKFAETGLKVPSKFTLQELRKFFRIPLVGSAHTADSDVNSLMEVFKRLKTNLNLETSDLVLRSFTALDVIKPKKAKIPT